MRCNILNRTIKHEINDIIKELNAISINLNELSHGIAQEFKGIGALHCAKSIENISHRNKKVSRELDKLL